MVKQIAVETKSANNIYSQAADCHLRRSHWWLGACAAVIVFLLYQFRYLPFDIILSLPADLARISFQFCILRFFKRRYVREDALFVLYRDRQNALSAIDEQAAKVANPLKRQEFMTAKVNVIATAVSGSENHHQSTSDQNSNPASNIMMEVLEKIIYSKKV
jgi:hypothetical protein